MQWLVSTNKEVTIFVGVTLSLLWCFKYTHRHPRLPQCDLIGTRYKKRWKKSLTLKCRDVYSAQQMKRNNQAAQWPALFCAPVEHWGNRPWLAWYKIKEPSSCIVTAYNHPVFTVDAKSASYHVSRSCFNCWALYIESVPWETTFDYLLGKSIMWWNACLEDRKVFGKTWSLASNPSTTIHDSAIVMPHSVLWPYCAAFWDLKTVVLA